MDDAPKAHWLPASPGELLHRQSCRARARGPKLCLQCLSAGREALSDRGCSLSDHGYQGRAAQLHPKGAGVKMSPLPPPHSKSQSDVCGGGVWKETGMLIGEGAERKPSNLVQLHAKPERETDQPLNPKIFLTASVHPRSNSSPGQGSFSRGMPCTLPVRFHGQRLGGLCQGRAVAQALPQCRWCNSHKTAGSLAGPSAATTVQAEEAGLGENFPS